MAGIKKKLLSRDQLLKTEEGRQHLAIALILYSDFRGAVGVDFVERATELHTTAEILGITDEVEKWQPHIPKGQWDL